MGEPFLTICSPSHSPEQTQLIESDSITASLFPIQSPLFFQCSIKTPLSSFLPDQFSVEAEQVRENPPFNGTIKWLPLLAAPYHTRTIQY